MTRYAKRTDANQSDVVDDFRQALPEASLKVMSGAGEGFPDLAVGWKGHNFLFEVKDPEKSPSARQLTRAQQDMHATWQGQIAVVHSASEMLACIAKYFAENARL